mmetsp:Transcript_15981/g.31900  ORF Transcript_15981/g.31900 Transcript_15981/m.31900 type:complete len:312 (-) Transcript_15981:208-1143(-)
MPLTKKWISLFAMCALRDKMNMATAKITSAFECTARQEAEDLSAIEAKEHRYHQSMVRLGICALKLAEQGDDGAKDSFRVKKESSHNNKLAEGVRWLEKAASLGNPEAKNNLAILLSKGHGVPTLDDRKPDHKKALAYYLEAAEDGCADAQFNLGVIFDTGRGGVVTADAAAAAHWFSQAADRNHLEATHALAIMEVSGRGVAVDLERAAKRFRKLAGPDVQPAYPNAQYMLALLALKGACAPDLLLGLVPADEEEDAWSKEASVLSDISVLGVAQPTIAQAVKLLRIAADSGHPQARDQMSSLLGGTAAA